MQDSLKVPIIAGTFLLASASIGYLGATYNTRSEIRQLRAENERLKQELASSSATHTALEAEADELRSLIMDLNSSSLVQVFDCEKDWSGYGDQGPWRRCGDGQYAMQCSIERFMQRWHDLAARMKAVHCEIRDPGNVSTRHHWECCD